MIALSAMALPAIASADSVLNEILAIDTGESWLPGPVNVVEESDQAWNDETDSAFLWAGDPNSGFLMSFDPDDDEVFLGWQIEF
ncbi:MAG: hypothetical protein E4H19_02860 [Chromatiales bacterium]|nr:MAG: hypothetical protein E4H19_02860 [Chromatiales bacterium]